uniref:Chalcone synthase n=1 Tax=Leersia perrieri TaxID=77586 RepID=A0A0D9WZ62_9ORYZ
MGSGSASASARLREIHRSQQADGPAAVLAIGTANPPACVTQDDFTDLLFRATNTDHLAALKDKFKRLCKHACYFGQKLGVERRYLHHTEETLAAHPEFADHEAPSLDARLDIAAEAVPELAARAARKAIAEWGRPAGDVTHLVVTTNSGAHIPGVDFRLVPLLGLRPTVRRTMLYLNGCFAGCAALRLAKDLAENNRGARVLVVAAELTVMLFSRPEEGCFQTLLNQGLFGDGAAAVVVGADPLVSVERPLFEIVSAAQTIIPESAHAINMNLTKGGFDGNISTREVPGFIGDNIERCLMDSFEPLGGIAGDGKWNDLFWAVHPGSPAILDKIESVLGLEPEKLTASRRVLRDYGNMFGVTVIFVLDELRRRWEREAAGEWRELGVMMTFGPGLTVETMVLHAALK